MDKVYLIALALHIAAGMTALIAGLFAIIAEKGKPFHRRVGKIYFWSMLIACTSALYISLVKQNLFLLHIGLFSLYLVFIGNRSIQNKNPMKLDWAMLILAILNGLFMLYSLQIILMVFGTICIWIAFRDLILFYRLTNKRPIHSHIRITRHIGAMLGSYIATFTAFLVVNITMTDYPWIPWLLPTLVGVPLIAIWTKKFTPKSINKSAVIPLLLFFTWAETPGLLAQTYIEGGHTRHRFAQLNIGIDQRFFPGSKTSTSFVNASGLIEKKELNDFTETRIHFGGTHFWGHADFYIAIPLTKKNASGFYTGVETGALYYPWAIRQKKIRPFIGAAFVPFYYQQGEGNTLMRFKYPINSGFTYNYRNHQFQLSCGLNFDSKEKYYIEPQTVADVKTSPIWFSLGYKFMLDTSIGAEKDWSTGRTQILTDTLASLNRLNGFTIGIGPSSAFFLKESNFLNKIAPAADQHRMVDVFMEYGLGYYLHNPDIQVNLSYRKNKSSIKAYDFIQTATRKALTLELYKFFCDYHGFAAFIGPSLSYESLQLNNENTKALKPGLTFGWDIRPNRIQSWYLRTNLRYFPNLQIQTQQGYYFHFDQLEFNFIQLIIFPERFF